MFCHMTAQSSGSSRQFLIQLYDMLMRVTRQLPESRKKTQLADQDITIYIRNAEFDDLSEILTLFRELSGRESEFNLNSDPETLNKVWGDIQSSGQTILVGERDGRVVGTCTLALLPSLRRGGRPWAELENVVVSEEHRDSGIGSLLVTRAIEIATIAGAFKMHVVSDYETSRAFAFYESQGFSNTGREYKKYL